MSTPWQRAPRPPRREERSTRGAAHGGTEPVVLGPPTPLSSSLPGRVTSGSGHHPEHPATERVAGQRAGAWRALSRPPGKLARPAPSVGIDPAPGGAGVAAGWETGIRDDAARRPDHPHAA